MALTLSLLALLYLALGAVVLAAGGGIAVTVALLAVMALGQLVLSERLALRAMHARVVSAQDAPGLHALVERLAIQADVPMPRLAISELPVPNAFAMGRSPKHATVCVTTPLLQILERHELEAVLAHEVGHIKNRDVALMTLASFFASIAALVGQVAVFGGFGGGRERDSGPGLAVILLVSVAVYVLSYFLMLALSRYREFAADRSAALFTGRPSALASALRRLERAARQAPEQDLREVTSMQAFFIVPVRAAGALSRLLATHPSTDERIERLARIEARLQQA